MLSIPGSNGMFKLGPLFKVFYEAKHTHMNIKPSNVVLDAKGTEGLIDISGIGGITYKRISGMRYLP